MIHIKYLHYRPLLHYYNVGKGDLKTKEQKHWFCDLLFSTQITVEEAGMEIIVFGECKWSTVASSS